MSGTDATRCKVCGGEFGTKRVLIDGGAYHPRCAVMSYPSHTHEDYSRLSNEFSEALGIIDKLLGLERGSGEAALNFLQRHGVQPAPDLDHRPHQHNPPDRPFTRRIGK